MRKQQPKIKLLRRQKSASELEVGNADKPDSDGTERPQVAPSKPDGIYQLIKQVLEAKRRGAGSSQQAQQAADDSGHLRAPLPFGASSALLNLSNGNLAQANKSGKSVSASALPSAADSLAAAAAASATVDRWAVVMNLLAQSRGKTTPVQADAQSPNRLTTDEAGRPQKRHSKQLDKFKLVAKSAAEVSRHLRHSNSGLSESQDLLLQLQQQQQQPQQQPQQQQQQHASPQSRPQYQQQVELQLVNAPAIGQQQSAVHLNATKSLPIGASYAQFSPQMLAQQQNQQHLQHQQQQYAVAAQNEMLAVNLQQLHSTSGKYCATTSRCMLLCVASLHVNSVRANKAEYWPTNIRSQIVVRPDFA